MSYIKTPFYSIGIEISNFLYQTSNLSKLGAPNITIWITRLKLMQRILMFSYLLSDLKNHNQNPRKYCKNTLQPNLATIFKY